jgi:23S rRNA (cytidine2498-2'-O)-methyltransferase
MTAIVLYCRPGFENDCGAEIIEKSGWNNIFGYLQLKKNTGLVYFHLHDGSQADELVQRLPLKRLIFTRDWFVTQGELLELPEYNRVEAISEALGGESFYSELRMETKSFI